MLSISFFPTSPSPPLFVQGSTETPDSRQRNQHLATEQNAPKNLVCSVVESLKKMAGGCSRTKQNVADYLATRFFHTIPSLLEPRSQRVKENTCAEKSARTRDRGKLKFWTIRLSSQLHSNSQQPTDSAKLKRQINLSPRPPKGYNPSPPTTPKMVFAQ